MTSKFIALNLLPLQGVFASFHRAVQNSEKNFTLLR